MLKKTLAALAAGFALVACNSADFNQPTKFGFDKFQADMQVLTALLANTEGNRSDVVKQNAPHLGRSLVWYLAATDRIPRKIGVEHIDLYWGSMKDIPGIDANGQLKIGHFENQLVAQVYLNDSVDPSTFIVSNFNVLKINDRLPEQRLQKIAALHPKMEFRIGKGEGLVGYHVDYRLAMALARQFNLKLYRDKNPNDEISVAEAEREEANTNRHQVTVAVTEGDKFDLVTKTYTPAPKVVSEESSVVKKHAPKKHNRHKTANKKSKGNQRVARQ